MAVQRWVAVLKIERARGSFSMAGREEELRSKEPNGGLLGSAHTSSSFLEGVGTQEKIVILVTVVAW